MDVTKFMNLDRTHIQQFLNFSDYTNVVVIVLNKNFEIIDYNTLAARIYAWEKNSKQGNISYFLKITNSKDSFPRLSKEKLLSVLAGEPILEMKNDFGIGSEYSWNIIANNSKGKSLDTIILFGNKIKTEENFLDFLEIPSEKEIQALSLLSEEITGGNIAKYSSTEYLLQGYRYLEGIISRLPCYVYWKNKDFIYVGCNDLTAQLLKLKTRSDIIGKTDYDFNWPEKDVDNYRKIDLEIIKTGKPILDLEEIVSLGDQSITLLVNKTPIFDEEGKVIGILGVSVDITQQKKAEEHAELANQAKGKFLSIMSHEIRGPVANVISAVDLIKPGHNLSPEDYQKMTHAIEYSARQALEILKNTSHYLELDSENFIQRTSIVYLPSFLNKLEQTYQNKCSKKVKFLCKLISKQVGRVEFDITQVRKILKIIIENAIKFTETGTIELSINLLAPNTLRFILTDTGCGISEGYLNNIFKTFLNPEILMSEKNYLKTGLKLPLAKRIAELTGGSLTISSEVGVGTIVYLDVPHQEVEMNNMDSFLENTESEGNYVLTHTTQTSFPFSILLVEDDVTNANLTLEVLKRLGCHVTWCDTAFKALDVLRKKTFDLIFIDITLPDMTGVAFADAALPLLPETTQIVAVTSHASDQDHDYYLKHGMMTMLGKPLTEADFNAFFQGYLRTLDGDE